MPLTQAERSRRFYWNHLEAERERNRHKALRQRWQGSNLKYSHGITLADYNARLAQQGGGCAICGEPPPENQRLDVDHDHDHCSGRGCGSCIRGLLCRACNVGIGKFQESTHLVQIAAAYMTGYLVPNAPSA